MRSEMEVVRIGYMLLFVAFAIDFKRVSTLEPEGLTVFAKIARSLNYAAEELKDSFTEEPIWNLTSKKDEIIHVPRLAYRLDFAERMLATEKNENNIQAYILARNEEDTTVIINQQRYDAIKNEFGKQVSDKVKNIEAKSNQRRTANIGQFIKRSRNRRDKTNSPVYTLEEAVEIAAFALVKRNLENANGSNLNITHPYGTANNLVKAGIFDPSLIAAAWLHDTVVETRKIKPQAQYNKAAPEFEKDEYEYTLTKDTLQRVAGESVANTVIILTSPVEKLILTAEAKAKYHQYKILMFGIYGVGLEMVDMLHNVQGWPMAIVSEYNRRIKNGFDPWFNPTLDLVSYLHRNDGILNSAKVKVVNIAHADVSSKLAALGTAMLVFNVFVKGSFLVLDAIDIMYQRRNLENFITTAMANPILLDDNVIGLLLDQEESFPYLQEFFNLFRAKQLQDPESFQNLAETSVDEILIKLTTVSPEVKDFINKNKEIVGLLLKSAEVVDILRNPATIYTLTGKQMKNTLNLRTAAERVAKFQKILPEIKTALSDNLLEMHYYNLKNGIFFNTSNIEKMKSGLKAFKELVSSDGTANALEVIENASYNPVVKVIQGLKGPVEAILLLLLENDSGTNLLPILEAFTGSTDELLNMRKNIETIHNQIQLISEIYYPYKSFSKLSMDPYDIKILESIDRLAPKQLRN